MLYTRKGDTGTTKTFNMPQGVRVSKSSCQTEALGTLDELNSFLGYVKVVASRARLVAYGIDYEKIIHGIQKNLFIVQAELAGAPKSISEEKVQRVEAIIDDLEKKMPPIKSFFISGGTDIAALLDVSRTIARRAERAVVRHNEEVVEAGNLPMPPVPEGGVLSAEDFAHPLKLHTMAYLNRLSSILYAMARYANFHAGITEEPPSYE